MHPFIPLALAPFLFFGTARSQSQACAPVTGIQLTYYGFADGNSDSTSLTCQPGVAHNQGGTAAGDGSFNNPFSFATSASSTNFQECEKIYVPYLQKYFIYMDHCTGCDNNHIDLWVGTDTTGGSAQISCEQNLGTQMGQTVIKDPPDNLPYKAQNLWDGSCHNVVGTNLFPNADTSNLCAGGGGSQGGASSSEAAGGAPSSSSTSSTSTLPVQNTPAQVPPVQTPPVQTPAETPVAPPTTTTTSTTRPFQPGHPQGPQQTTTQAPQHGWQWGNPPVKYVKHTTMVTVTMPSSNSTHEPASGGCPWEGHCIGAHCTSYNDCWGDWICIQEKCHSNLDD